MQFFDPRLLRLNLVGWCEFKLNSLLPEQVVLALISAQGLVALQPFWPGENSSGAAAYRQQLVALQAAGLKHLDATTTNFWQREVNLSLNTGNLSCPLDMQGTEFQLAVWNALLAIPKGETCTYAQLAAKIQRPRAFRAVGTACGANHLPFIVPCHRVLASDGSLGGFAFGLPMKQQLLLAENYF